MAGGKIETAIAQSCTDAFAAFLHGNVRPADDSEVALERGGDVHFGFDEMPNTAALNVLKSIPRCLGEKNSRGRGPLLCCCRERILKRDVMLGILRGAGS